MIRPALASSHLPGSTLLALLLAVAFPTLLSGSPAAGLGAISSVHEVPADVAVQLWVRPADDGLSVLVRVPFESMRDLDVPLREGRYLELTDPRWPSLLRDAARLWIVDYLTFYEEGRVLGEEEVVAVRLTLPTDRSFAEFDRAQAHILQGEPLSPSLDLPPGQAFLDVALRVPVADPSADFSVESGLAHLGIETRSVLHFLPIDGGERVFTWQGDPGRLHLDPGFIQAFLRFGELGFLHILTGWDHLLFLLCLLLPVANIRLLVPVVTAFTLAHSMTLGAAALGMAPSALWFPPLVEALIAASIVWMALENVLGVDLSRRWAVAFGFGLIHGFGFSFLLTESLQLAGGQLVASLVAFNLGVEFGQLAVVVAAVPVVRWILGRIGERMGVLIGSVLVGHTAWHWMMERGGALLAYDLRLPAVDAAFAASLLRWVALLLGAVGVAWALSGWSRRWSRAALEERLDPTEG